MKGEDTLARFIVRTFLWLPVCFGVWYLAAPAISAVAASVAGLIVHAVAPGILAGIERAGHDLAFVTTLQVDGAPGQIGVLVPEVHALTYTYGLALFLALMLAARSRAWTMLAGVSLLVLVQGWGIAFDFLAHVGIKLGPVVSMQAGLAGWRAEFIALAYQMGALIFPSLVPVLLWAAFNRGFIARLARSPRITPGWRRGADPAGASGLEPVAHRTDGCTPG